MKKLKILHIRFLFQRTFDIREGEMRRAVLMQLNIFLLISTLLIIKPTINSLFLTNVGIEKLPLAFILVALGAGIITSFYSRLLRSVPLKRIIFYTLFASVLTIALFAILLRLNHIEKWVLYLFYVWVAIFGVLSASQFWILANIVFNTREAKRLFGLIGSGAIVGGIFGGYLTSILATSVGSENLLFVGMSFLLICIPVNAAIWKSQEINALTYSRQRKRMGSLAERPVRLIRNSRHLTYLALITILVVMVARLIDYQFSAISSAKIPDEDELTAFFGFWFSNFNIISLIIQLFITRRVVGLFGVGLSLYFLPAGIFVGALALLLLPGLWSAVFVKLCDGSMKQSINKSAIELLALPIPAEIKNQAKTFIDVVVDSFATGVSGIILVTLVNGLAISARFISIPVILLIFIWLYFATKVRREYVLLFKQKLKQNRTERNNGILDVSNDTVFGGLKRVLEHGTEKQILYLLQHMQDIKHERLFPNIRNLLKHPSAAIRAEALRKLYYYKTEKLIEEANLLVQDADYNVKVAAIEYLIEHAYLQRIDVIDQYLKDNDYRVSGATMLSLTNEIRDNPGLKTLFSFETLVDERIDRLKTTTDPEELRFRKINLLRIMGLLGQPKYFPIIMELLNETDTEIQQQAILTAGTTLEPAFIPLLVTFLKRKEIRNPSTLALANYGVIIIDYFRDEISKQGLDDELLRIIPGVVGNIESQKSVDFLFELLDIEDHTVRSETLDALSRLKLNYPQLIIGKKNIIQIILEEARLYQTIISALYSQQKRMKEADFQHGLNNQNEVFEARKSLIEILERRLDDNLDRIFKLLGLKYPPDEIETIYRNIKSDKPDLRMNAVEFLDNLLEINLKKVLIPIMETVAIDTITKETFDNLNIKVPSQYECFNLLLQGKDAKLKLAVFFLIAKLQKKKYLPLVMPYQDSPNIKIRTFAQRAITALNGNY
jgi:AAA family ATP:ADP antiporter